MERPKSFTGQELGSEKTRVLSWMPPIDHQRTLIGQYVKSTDGSKPAFQDEEDVSDGSRCATFCAAEARIENERWSGVPILLKAGKALDKTEATVTINFRHSPNAMLFQNMVPNRMTIRVQPDEGIFLRVNTRVPDLHVRSEATVLDMSYRGTEIPEAYEALFLDVLRDVQYRRVTADEVQVSWDIFTPLLQYLEEEGVVPGEYPYGSSGPQGLDEFVASRQQSVPS
ncbi:MAG: Glucose-6-phosphate 1-dehydrogenase [Ramalina farinacea]|uniref:Glucose-6-phosphate 1-dehydrogenase n=1 Tax=Ramalina farinacea TaxID=258253 RepID=A0AA43QPV5_9LECA|nr:Glucose-6-phosphate 1-dehydrogenase [Ramalina farinacea]